MSELSNRLRELVGEFESVRYEVGSKYEAVDLAVFVADNLESIIKNDETVEGIDLLQQDPLFMVKTGIASGQIEILTSKGWTYGPDLHTAVMAAVEKAREE